MGQVFQNTITLIIIIILLSCKAYGIGLGDWYEKTRNETLFNDPGNGITITIKGGIYCENLSSWYFYKDHIVGIKIQYEYSSRDKITNYFVIDEINRNIIEFNDKNPWQEYILTQKLTLY